MRVDRYAKATAASVILPHALSVGNIEHLNADLQLLPFAPGHRKALAQTHIKVDITGDSEHVTITRFTWFRIPEALVSRQRVTAE